jgi:pimeloyl-ACP methyl ester carboxylesterase
LRQLAIHTGHKTLNAFPGPDEGGVLDRISVESGATLPYYRNYSLSKTAAVMQAVVVVHGTDRNVQDYFDSIARAAADLCVADHTIIIAPYFQIGDDEPEQDDAYWTDSGPNSWKDGGNAVTPAGFSSFKAMDEILTTLADKERFPELTQVTLVGHSAGGQFTQRYAAGGRAPGTFTNLTIDYVTANPSSYLYLNPDRPVDDGLPDSCPHYNDYEYGLEDRNEYMSTLCDEQIRQQYTTQRVTYLLGSADIYQNHKIDTSCMARAQGENRFQRGQFYYSSIHTLFPSAPHDMVVVPEVGHDHDAMFNSTQGKTAIFHDHGEPDQSQTLREDLSVSNKHVNTRRVSDGYS